MSSSTVTTMPSSKRSTGAAACSGRQKAVCSPESGGALTRLAPEPKPASEPALNDDGGSTSPAGRRRTTTARAAASCSMRAGAGHGALDQVEGDARRHLRRGLAGTDVEGLAQREAGGERAALDRGAGHRDAVDGRLALARPEGDAGTGASRRVGEDEGEGRRPVGERAHLAGDGGEHAVGPGAGDAEAGVQGRDEGGRAGRVDPQQSAAAAGDDRVSGEDFTAVGHGLQPSDRPAVSARARPRHAGPSPRPARWMGHAWCKCREGAITFTRWSPRRARPGRPCARSAGARARCNRTRPSARAGRWR